MRGSRKAACREHRARIRTRMTRDALAIPRSVPCNVPYTPCACHMTHEHQQKHRGVLLDCSYHMICT